MATRNDTIATQDPHFTLAFVVKALATSSRTHDPEGFCKALAALDMAPVDILRGLAYLTHLIESQTEGEHNHRAARLAQGTVAEMTELIAEFVELANTAEIDSMIREGRAST